MENSSADESDISFFSNESDISDSEIVEYNEKTCDRLRSGKMKVKHGEKAFRCPFCPGKKKQDYNFKDLLQHATDIGAAPKRKAMVRAKHQGLAMYLDNDLSTSSEKSLQLVIEPKPPRNDYVWPWVGILVNLPTELTNRVFAREGEDRLKAQFSRFRPLEVTILWNPNDQIFCAIIRFAKEWSGFHDASDIELHFIQEKYGKTEWNQRNCRKDDLYGWLATTDDYYSPGPIGEHLRKNGALRSVCDVEREGLQKIDRRVAEFARQIEEKNKQLRELELKKNQNAMKLHRMTEEKDRLVKEHNEKITEMLQTRRGEINQRCKRLEDLASKSNIVDRAKIEAEIEKNAKENELLDLAILKQKEENEDLFCLHEEQKSQEETDDTLRSLIALEKHLATKHELELEIEQLRGKLEVTKHRGAQEDTKLKQELEEMSENLKLNDDEMEYIDSMNQGLIVKEERTSQELEEAKEEMIRALEQRSGKSVARPNMIIGVKRIGELDQKAFRAACKEKLAKDDIEGEFALLYSKWEHEIRQPEWYISADGSKKEIIQEDDEKLQALKAEFGKGAHDLVVKALHQMRSLRPSIK